LAPAIIVTIFFGAFQSSENFGDLYAMLALGFMGWLMKQLGWPRAPFLVGFVLTKPTEQYLWLSISRYDFEWLFRPAVIFLGLLLLASIIWTIRARRTGSSIGADEGEGPPVLGKIPSICFTLAVLVVGVGALYEARTFPYLGAIFPIAATIPTIVMAAAQLVLDFRSAPLAAAEDVRKRTQVAFGYFVSLVVFLLLILLLGFGIATALFAFAFLYGWVKLYWFRALLYTGALVAVAQLMGTLLNLYWPTGILIQRWWS
jgi:hypothetical protein